VKGIFGGLGIPGTFVLSLNTFYGSGSARSSLLGDIVESVPGRSMIFATCPGSYLPSRKPVYNTVKGKKREYNMY